VAAGTVTPVLDHFGWLAPHYERVIRVNGVERLAELAGLPFAGRLLDAGGGTGRIAQHLRERVDELVVADASAGMLRQAQAKPGLHAVCSGAEGLPFPDGSFDRVVMVDALHHVADQRRTADELWRVLRPGGRLVIEEPDVRRWQVKLIALGEKAALMRSHFLAPPAIAALFARPGAGVRIVAEGAQAWVVVDKEGDYTCTQTT
jgi:demethylmenaquinone methyltransferase/2-methoxy-6-polyprenyl-1,4-benzoquinol methylase